MKVYKGVVVKRIYQTITIAANSEQEAKQAMLDEFSVDDADSEMEVRDMEEVELTLNANQQAFVDAYYRNVDSDDSMRDVIAVYLNRKTDKGFIDEFGTSMFTKISDHWDMWISAHDYLITAVKKGA